MGARKLNIEVNNGRLAMLGLMGFVSEAKVPGAVPALAGLIKKYDGQPMAPFAENDVSLGFVKEMLAFKLGIQQLLVLINIVQSLLIVRELLSSGFDGGYAIG